MSSSWNGSSKTINTTGGPVDVWAVDGVDEKDLVGVPGRALLLAQAP